MDPPTSSFRHRPVVAATCSWASLFPVEEEFVVSYALATDGDPGFGQGSRLSILDIGASLTGLNPFGRVSDGFMSIIAHSYQRKSSTIMDNVCVVVVCLALCSSTVKSK